MNARDYALLKLDAEAFPHWPARAIARRQAVVPDDPRDLALGEQIYIGVVKNLLLLQHLIQHHSKKSLKSIDAIVQKILAIGLYQLRFLDRIPPSAAVDQAVEQTKRFRIARASGFVNAVLRNALREPAALPTPDNPRDYATITLSHPLKLFDRLVCAFGEQRAIDFCAHNQSEPPTIVRAIDAATLVGDSFSPHEQAGMLIVHGAKAAQLAEWANQGIAQVQDPTAASIVPQLQLQPGQSALDRCCGLGTKTLQIAELVGPTGRVVAIDPNKSRCQRLARTLKHRGVSNTTIHTIAWMRDLKDTPVLSAAEGPTSFDRILIDAPCSNSGVLARRPEARYHQSDKNLRSLANLQDDILDDTAPFLSDDGIMVYSTCSIWPEENQSRIAAFLTRHPQFALTAEQSTWPAGADDPKRYRDGGYVAVLRRK